ncbi:MAG: MBL fold metallo-hydrolase [Anaeroplasmataceae bacterium]
MKVCMIASGSKGNACYVETDDSKFIIDAGISKKRIITWFKDNNIEESIDAILVTHEHVDHISGLALIAKHFNCPVYLTEGTYEGAIKKNDSIKDIDARFIKNSDEFLINNTIIKSIPTFHDALDPNGYLIQSKDTKLVYITDTGYVHLKFYELISNADIYVIETNHDPQMLMSCKTRPYQTLIRILGDHGHMSNADGIDTLSTVMGDKTKIVFYAHISEECNLVDLIKLESTNRFESLGMDVSNVKFIYTSQLATEVVEV